MFFYQPQYIGTQVLANQQEITSAVCGHWMYLGEPARNDEW